MSLMEPSSDASFSNSFCVLLFFALVGVFACVHLLFNAAFTTVKGFKKEMVETDSHQDSPVNENEYLRKRIKTLSQQLQLLEENQGKSAEALLVLPKEVFVAKGSLIFHLNCHHLNREGSSFTKYRLCRDCHTKNS